ncbi:hypothetical protein EDD11_003637 [Mortierella claussenii]|nr:hypothetical protein EDD11_003637 [Mortierella claussenii]
MCTFHSVGDKKGDQNMHPRDGTKLVVRLDLRKLMEEGSGARTGTGPEGTGEKLVPGVSEGEGGGGIRTRKSSLRRHSKKGPAEAVQTTLNANSWSAAKIMPERPIAANSMPEPPSSRTRLHSHVISESLTAILTDKAEQILNSASRPILSSHTATESSSIQDSQAATNKNPRLVSENQVDSRTENDEDDMERDAQIFKKQASSRILRGPVSRKRARAPDRGAVKKKKVGEEVKRPRPVTLSKGATKRLTKNPMVPRDIVSITGDEDALKFNNDYCEACMGLGEFICCDSCPKAFHFSCCQPPMDPLDLPDEWNCNECHAAKDFLRTSVHDLQSPPQPSKPGVFKQLLDNINRANPKAFALPSEIRSFFKGVVANSDGDYDDAEHKPRSKRSSSVTATGFMSPAEEEALQPRRRKRRDAVFVQVDNPDAANDGDIEIIPDPDPVRGKRSIWDIDTSGILYRVPEKSIKQSFIAKCQRVRESAVKTNIGQAKAPGSYSGESSALSFDLLVAAVMASEHISDIETSSKLDDYAESQCQGQGMVQDQHREQEQNSGKGCAITQEEMQNNVLGHLTDPTERQEYLRFRAFQRFVREHGMNDALSQWVEQHEREKERAATQGLLNL